MDPGSLEEGQLSMPAERGVFSRPIRKDEGWFLIVLCSTVISEHWNGLLKA